jgi:hypothetical protein
MPGQAKVGGTWRTASRLSVKISGQWKTVTAAYVKVNGQWRQWFASRIEDTFSRASSVSSLGTAESGQTWLSFGGGVWKVNGSQQASCDESPSSNALTVADLYSSSFDARVSTSVKTRAI